jgi:RNA polymerase sigma factor (sigma-70 family)
MGDPGIAALFDRLRSSDADAAWEEFLHRYSPVLYQAAHNYTDHADAAADCFLNICEHLSCNRYRRLLKFRLEGRASFTTWLRVVARNVCFDWHRSQTGRRRPFKSMHSLSQLELEVYGCRFERGLSTEETLQHLRATFPEIDPSQVAEAEQRIEHSLSSRQHWILSTRQSPAFRSNVALLSEDDTLAQVADPRSDQETLIADQQQQAQLKKCVAALPAEERLLLRLRFEEALSLEDIARLSNLGDAQRVYRHIAAILKKLRASMK